MFTAPDESRLSFGLAAWGVPLGDDEIASHLEALDDGRDFPLGHLEHPVELQDDEIASHLEEGAMLFEPAPSRPRRGRRSLRH